jgi:hypothetical protein
MTDCDCDTDRPHTRQFTDAELAAFIAQVKAADGEPHQDWGDVGYLFAALGDHRVLDELMAARRVVAAARRVGDLHPMARYGTLDAALADYDKLFAETR